MRVLLTGGCGFIGSHVIDLLIKEGHSVWCIDNLSTGKRENLPKDIELAEIDIRSWYDLVSEFVDCRPEIVIHLAGQPSLEDSMDNPIKDGTTNIIGTLNILRASQKIRTVQKIIFSSTSAVYIDLLQTLPTPENYIKSPRSPYGISKYAAEMYIQNLMPNNNVILRFGNVYGPRQVPLGENQVVPKMIRHFEKGDPFFIHGDGLQSRDMIYVEDVARACLSAINGVPGIYNIASGKATSVNDMAKTVAKLYDVPEYPWDHDKQNDPRQKVELDIFAANEGLNWKPEVDLETGLQETIAWWKKQ